MTQIEKLKEKVCSFIQKEDNSYKIYECGVFREGGKIEEEFTIQHNEVFYIVPNMLYYG